MIRKPTSDSRPAVQRHQHRPAVLVQRRPVALDAVDPVGAPLDLAHRRRQRDASRRPGRARARAGRRCPPAAGPASGSSATISSVLPGVIRSSTSRSTRARSLGVDRARQPDEGDAQRDQRQHQLQGQCPRVAEAVAVPEPDERRPSPGAAARSGAAPRAASSDGRVGEAPSCGSAAPGSPTTSAAPARRPAPAAHPARCGCPSCGRSR